MSLVGPRPEVPLYTDRYSLPQRRVFSARPGITGPSIIFNEEQLIAGRPDKELFYMEVILPAKLEIDIAYCADIRFVSDLRFLALTFGRLFHPESRADSRSIQHLVSSSRPLEPISDKR